MASFRDPVGPLPPSVYWRRRIIVGVVLLAIIVVIAMIIFRPAGDSDAQADSSAADTSQTDSSAADSADTAAADSEDPGTIDGTSDGDADAATDGTSDGGSNETANTCDASDISLTAVADDVVYQKGENPKLRLQVTNAGGTDCDFNVGTSQQNFVISSGEEVIWASEHCEEDPQDSVMTLKANETLQTDTISWDRTKSSEAKCNAGPISGIADATYQFHVEIGDIQSDKVRLRILN